MQFEPTHGAPSGVAELQLGAAVQVKDMIQVPGEFCVGNDCVALTSRLFAVHEDEAVFVVKGSREDDQYHISVHLTVTAPSHAASEIHALRRARAHGVHVDESDEVAACRNGGVVTWGVVRKILKG
jgi:hypothetical protein